MGQSPNKVTRTVVLNPGGQQAQYGQTAGDSDKRPKRRRRDDLLSNFPKYNDSLAPRTVRKGASLAQDPGGLIVLTGGNDQDPLSIFDAPRNQWVDPTQLIGEQSQTPLVASPMSSISLPTASASATSTPSDGSSRPRPLTVLGAVLGSISGIAAILIIALLLLRWRKHKKYPNRQDSEVVSDKPRKSSRLSFEDQGMQPFKAAAQPMGRTSAPASDDMTMVGGRSTHNRESSSITSRLKFDPQRSSNIGFGPGMFSRHKGALSISRPIPQEQSAELQERPITSGARAPPNLGLLGSGASHRKNDSSWSTYFTGNAAEKVGENRNTIETQASHVSSGSRGGYWPDPSAPVAKLKTATPGLTDSHGNELAKMTVRKGSPSIRHSGFDQGGRGVAIAEGIPAKISNTDSISTGITDGYDPRHTIESEKTVGSAYPSSQPMEDYGWAFQDSSWSGPPHRLIRPPSSTYTDSMTQRGVEDWSKSSIRPVTQWPGDVAAFPAVPSSRPGTSRGPNSLAPHPLRTENNYYNNTHHNTANTNNNSETRDFFGSNHHHHHRDPSTTNDMSWLNLNGNGTGTGPITPTAHPDGKG